MIKKALLIVLIILLVVVVLVVVNTLTLSSTQERVHALPAPEINPTALQHFKGALAFKTISNSNPALFDSLQFIGFRKYLESTYPNFHAHLQREIVKGYTLLFTWKGKNPLLKPVVLMAHQDVVPIEADTESLWTVDPFAGEVKNDFIWGRGTTDDKINLIGMLEAAEKLLATEFQPERTIYFSFGHDEEIGGSGAIAVANLLKERRVQAEFVMDEGGIITKNQIPGITKPVALLGTSEKGYLSLVLSVEQTGGHSSMPSPETSIDILTRAIVRLRAKPFEARFSESMNGFIESLGPEMPFTQRMAFANPWLFRGLIIGIYEKSAGGNAMIRTTVAPTIIHAGIKDNVIPTLSTATLNFRLLPGDKGGDIIAQVKEIINDDRVSLVTLPGSLSEASAVTPMTSVGYQKISAAIKSSYPDLLTSPFLMIGATDSRYFGEVSTNIIKFSPMIDPIGFHGINERVSLESYKTTLWFYEQLLSELH
ncbi:MAG: M20 family peptidase [Cyclobacteriaceae bacterium]|nr:M20 family peptidase [Cyclobacteriaceae bacterium]